MGKLRHLFSILLLTTLLAAGAWAQSSNLTQIRDTIYNADGTPFNGTVVITWVGFSTPTSGTVSPLSTSARIYNGALSVLLVPSTTAAAGSYYQVVYYSSNGTSSWTEAWSVPASTNALSVSGVRTSTTSGSGTTTPTGTTSGSGSGSSGGTQYATLPIAISQVTGLSTSLNTLSTSLASLTTTVNGLSSNGSGNASATALEALTTTVNNLSATVTTNGNTLTALGTSYTNLSAASATNAGTLSALGTTVNNLGATVTTNGNTLSSLNTTVNGLSTNVSALTSMVNGLNSNVTSNATNLTSLNQTVSALSSSVTNLNSTVGALQSGSGNVNVAFVDGETPGGTLNGVNTVFTLSQAPTPTGSLELYRNGLVQTSGVDYTVSGSHITFLAGNIPLANDLVQAYYRVTGTSPVPVFADAEVPAGAVNGSNLTFTLAFTPSPLIGLRLYKNGILLAQHGDYTVSGQTITFVSQAIPQTSDALTAYYRH